MSRQNPFSGTMYMKTLSPVGADIGQGLFAPIRMTDAPIGLTQKERDIFSLVEFNAEESATNIAKKLKVPVASVHYTLRRLIDNEIIRPRCFINSYQLGLIDVGFYFSLSEQSKRARENLIKRFKEHSNVVYIGSVLGDFQYVAVIMCRDLMHFSELISELTGSSDSFISDKQIIPRLSYTRFPRKYISPRLTSYQSMALGVKEAAISIDDTDTRIVWALGNRPYESLRELGLSLIHI